MAVWIWGRRWSSKIRRLWQWKRLKGQMPVLDAVVCLPRGAVVVKTAKPDQDLRFDVPAVGLETLHSMMETGCKVLCH